MSFSSVGRRGPAIAALLAALFVLGTKNPGDWFVWRMVQCAFVFAVAAWIITGLAGPLLGFAITMYLLTQYYWRDIWTHLFLSEPWAITGAAIFAVGIWCLRGPRRADAPLSLATLGFLIAAGAKQPVIPIRVRISATEYRCKQIDTFGQNVLAIAPNCQSVYSWAFSVLSEELTSPCPIPPTLKSTMDTP